MQIKNIDSVKDVQKTKEILKDEVSFNKNEDKSSLILKNQDTVVISEKAKEMLNVYNKVPFDQNKVNDLKERIMNGTYKMDYNNIAIKIIESDV